MYKTFNCLVCDKESRFRYANANRFCSVQCQHTHVRNEKIRKWLEEGISWELSRRVPDWAISAMSELRGYNCSICGISDYNGKPIRLECDHMDGNYTNNHIDNLRFLCPNCHSQTDTYKNKNKGNGRQHRRKMFQ
jgi:endogenous inhibitor of DNA gyrase (YacG/DUF329 family)